MSENRINNNEVHLCVSCINDYPMCDSCNIYFGDGVGNDNICSCSSYEPVSLRNYEAEIANINSNIN